MDACMYGKHVLLSPRGMLPRDDTRHNGGKDDNNMPNQLCQAIASSFDYVHVVADPIVSWQERGKEGLTRDM